MSSEGRVFLTLSLGNIPMEVNESLDALEQIYAELDPMNCCRLPTVPPNMASLTAKSLFQFHHILGDPHANSSNCDLRSLSTISFSDQQQTYVTTGSESFAIAICQRTSKKHREI